MTFTFTLFLGAWGSVVVKALATSRIVPGSIPSGVTVFSMTYSFRPYHGPEVDSAPSENVRNVPGGKGGRCVRLTTSPTSHAEYHEIWEPKSPGTLWATPGLLRDSFYTFF